MLVCRHAISRFSHDHTIYLRPLPSFHLAFFREDVRIAKAGINKALGGGNDFDVTERGYDSDWDDLDVGTGDDADIVDLLSDSGAALQHDENGMLPLHYGKFGLLRIAHSVPRGPDR